MISAGIYGATGYTGYELVKILQRHPEVAIGFVTSESQAGRTLDEVYPAASRLPLAAGADAPLDGVDVVFLCLPHGAAAATAVTALNHNLTVIDLSADFRLRDPVSYAQWYGQPHPAPELLAEAVYGLTEFARAELPQARLIANPGCYPTSVLLALQPALATGAVGGPLIADSKSGISGAGRAPKQHTHFVEAANNFSPYSIGRSHRHLPEMEQFIGQWSAAPLIFSPHLLPVPRGILSTIYAPLKEGWTETAVRDLYAAQYDQEPFVRLLPAGQPATLAHAVQTNQCVIGLTVAAGTLILTAAIDNLLKGAAGQAAQNMNVRFGFEETIGLV